MLTHGLVLIGLIYKLSGHTFSFSLKSQNAVGDRVEVLNYQNLFTKSDLANWFSNYVQFCSTGRHFSERAELLGIVGK